MPLSFSNKNNVSYWTFLEIMCVIIFSWHSRPTMGTPSKMWINDTFQGLFWCFIPDSGLLSWPDCCAMFGVTHRLKKNICCFFYFARQSGFGNFTCRRSNRDSWGHHERPCRIFHLEWTVALSTAFDAKDLTNLKRKKGFWNIHCPFKSNFNRLKPKVWISMWIRLGYFPVLR